MSKMCTTTDLPPLTDTHSSVEDFADDEEDVRFDSETTMSNKTLQEKRQRRASGRLQIAVEETKKVRQWRILLVFLLVLVGAGLCAGTYWVIHQESSNDYKLSFNLFANSIEASLANHRNNLHDGVRNLGDTITASADDGHVFPFVVVDKFEIHAEHALDRSKMEAITFAPLVNNTLVPVWEKFASQNQDWIEKSRSTFLDHLPSHRHPPVYLDGQISPYIYRRRDGIFPEPSSSSSSISSSSSYIMTSRNEASSSTSYYAPAWYMSPPPMNPGIVNFDMFSRPHYRQMMEQAIQHREAAFSPIVDDIEDMISMQVSDTDHKAYHETFVNEVKLTGYHQPHLLYTQPVFATSKNQQVVGVLVGAIAFDAYLANLLPEGVHGVYCIVRSECNGERRSMSYLLDGAVPTYLGEGEHYHDTKYDHMKRVIPFFVSSSASANDHNITATDTSSSSECRYWVDVHPSSTFEESYSSPVALIAAITVAVTFGSVVLFFYAYDKIVSMRNKKVNEAAKRSHDLVNAMFPAKIRDRLMAAEEDTTLGNSSDGLAGEKASKLPIADFFPEATILFADIVGFTAWASAREPAQVFTLLETLFSGMDAIAKRRRVFKVETVGDCYVAACGVPESRKDHALVMARFARDCLTTAMATTQKLEVTLGPDTGDLAMRMGLHSGPVTAGVLRGDNARFQLFGDTMNTTARVESSGMANRIHISQECADLLIAAGKAGWIAKREDTVVAKGKGELTTYWLRLTTGTESTHSGSSVSDLDEESDDEEESSTIPRIPVRATSLPMKTQRLINWNSSLIRKSLSLVLHQRDQGKADEDMTVISPKTSDQISDYVTQIAVRYHDANPFHSFEHASHVTMSVAKLLSRVVAQQDCTTKQYAATIASDTLMQLGAVMSALIHDIDHCGVPNSRLIEEKPEFAAKYNNKSVAERNSIDVAWELFLRPEYEEFRKCIAPTDADLVAFHQTIVNATLATDIMDKDLKADRNARWAHAFSGEESDELKVRIVLEHMIQASDVAHTMQHWHVYLKWNERLFMETYKAWSEGRATKNPADFWYQGEIGFFDYYIIPLAKKLADCGVFGVSSDEYLNYATRNRKEWSEKGRGVVQKYIDKCEMEYGSGPYKH